MTLPSPTQIQQDPRLLEDLTPEELVELAEICKKDLDSTLWYLELQERIARELEEQDKEAGVAARTPAVKVRPPAKLAIIARLQMEAARKKSKKPAKLKISTAEIYEQRRKAASK
jgi:hypothetical protein